MQRQAGVVTRVTEQDKPQFELIFFDVLAMCHLEGCIGFLSTFVNLCNLMTKSLLKGVW